MIKTTIFMSVFLLTAGCGGANLAATKLSSTSNSPIEVKTLKIYFSPDASATAGVAGCIYVYTHHFTDSSTKTYDDAIAEITVDQVFAEAALRDQFAMPEANLVEFFASAGAKTSLGTRLKDKVRFVDDQNSVDEGAPAATEGNVCPAQITKAS